MTHYDNITHDMMLYDMMCVEYSISSIHISCDFVW